MRCRPVRSEPAGSPDELAIAHNARYRTRRRSRLRVRDGVGSAGGEALARAHRASGRVPQAGDGRTRAAARRREAVRGGPALEPVVSSRRVAARLARRRRSPATPAAGALRARAAVPRAHELVTAPGEALFQKLKRASRRGQGLFQHGEVHNSSSARSR